MKVDPRRSTLSVWNPARDHRHGIKAHEGSGANTHVVESRRGCRLSVPPELLKTRAGTMTLDEYNDWSERR